MPGNMPLNCKDSLQFRGGNGRDFTVLKKLAWLFCDTGQIEEEGLFDGLFL